MFGGDALKGTVVVGHQLAAAGVTRRELVAQADDEQADGQGDRQAIDRVQKKLEASGH